MLYKWLQMETAPQFYRYLEKAFDLFTLVQTS